MLIFDHVATFRQAANPTIVRPISARALHCASKDRRSRTTDRDEHTARPLI